MTISKNIARIISDLFVPPMFSLAAFILLGSAFQTGAAQKISVIASGATFGFIFPIIFFLYLRKKGKVVNNDATVKEERTFPYLIGILFCLSGFISLYLVGANPISYSLWLAYAVNSLLLIAVNKFWKISAHAIGAATFLALLFYLYGAAGLYFIILLAAIGTARLILKVHTPMQVLMGGLFGFFLTYWQLIIYVEKLFK